MNEKTITYHNCHGFKWQNINILTIFLYGPTPFLARWIMIAPNIDCGTNNHDTKSTQ
jgi:hypothetical protein